jgi:hypothetical protein
MMRCALYIFFGLILLSFHSTTGEKKITNYIVYLDDKPVGKLMTSQYLDKGNTYYHLSSEVNVNYLIDVEIKEMIEETFVRNCLNKSTHTRYINGSLKENNNLYWNGNEYISPESDSEPGPLKEVITGTTLSVYFEEPKNMSQLYSQSKRKLLPLYYDGQGTYTLQLTDEKQTFFKYAAGKLIQVDSESFWGKVKFALVQ